MSRSDGRAKIAENLEMVYTYFPRLKERRRLMKSSFDESKTRECACSVACTLQVSAASIFAYQAWMALHESSRLIEAHWETIKGSSRAQQGSLGPVEVWDHRQN